MPETAALLSTPLTALHEALGARLVEFAGYSMPVQYAAGIIKEHVHTRSHASLFDVSHMGQLLLTGPGAAAALESLVPVDVVGLREGRQRYAFFTNAAGGILDDIMIANLGDALLLVVNAACKERDVAHLRDEIGARADVAIEPLPDRALLALQGPEAARVLAPLAPRTAEMTFMDVRTLPLLGHDCHVSRSGYTGEDGFEISVPAAAAEALARTLLDDPAVAPAGLGARDSLRLEAGLCLYGHDLDETTTPVEASLAWALSTARRAGGARPGGYPGADRIFEQLANGAERRRVGLMPRSRAPVREGAEVVDAAGNRVGVVTSGGFGPTLGGPVAMGYVAASASSAGTELAAFVRNKAVPLEVSGLTAVAHRYLRD